jgi:hypothetical protein
MEVAAADPTGMDLDEDLVDPELRDRAVGYLETPLTEARDSHPRFLPPEAVA